MLRVSKWKTNLRFTMSYFNIDNDIKTGYCENWVTRKVSLTQIEYFQGLYRQ